MKRKLFCLALCLLAALSVQGATYLEYGDKVLNYPMNPPFSDSNSLYWYIYSGKAACSISDEDAYEGRTSLKLDTALLETDSRQQLIFHTYLSITNEYEIGLNDICFNIYSKGYDEKPEVLKYVIYFEYADGTTRNYQNFTSLNAENGWTRNTCTVPMSDYGDFKYCRMGILYNIATDVNPSVIYFDSMEARFVPKSIRADDVVCRAQYVNLDDLRIFGENSVGEEKLIDAGECTFSVKEGKAIIDGRKLICAGDNEAVVLTVDFWGKKYDMTIEFRNSLSYSEPFKDSDGNICVNVSNTCGKPSKVGIIAAIYEGDRLYKTANSELTLQPDESGILSCRADIPKKLVNPSVKIYVYDDINGFNGFNKSFFD